MIEEHEQTEAPIEAPVAERKPDIRKVYIKNYGNLMLDILNTSAIGINAYSTKQNEDLFIPWTSIIFISLVQESKDESGD